MIIPQELSILISKGQSRSTGGTGRAALLCFVCRQIVAAIELVGELGHVDLRQLAALQTQSNPILLLLAQRENRTAHEAAGEDAALHERFLQAA